MLHNQLSVTTFAILIKPTSVIGGHLENAKDRWMELCERATTEQNPERFNEILNEIIRLLSEKSNRIGQKPPEQAR
jgi:hypothetical protein